MLQVLEAIYLGKATPEAGGGGGSVDYSKTVQKSAIIPTASASNAGQVYMYTGDTNATYTHGYIYENQATITYTADVTITPSSVTATALGFAAMFADYSSDPAAVKSGTMSYDGSIWHIDGYDANNNKIVDNLKLYTEDLQDYGFTFTDDPQSGDTITYTCTITISSASYAWVRLDVQPAGTSGADTSLSNLTDAGKIKSAHLAMPSNTYTDLTYTAPSQTFLAPADGYFFFNVDAITYTGVVHLSVYPPDASEADKQNTFAAYYGCCDSRPNANSEVKQTVPVLKGQYCTIKCTSTTGTPKFVCRFIYAQGSESEKQGA